MFEFNRALDAMFLRPFADYYRLLLPPPVQNGCTTSWQICAPVILVNDLLQGEWERAGTTTRRFIVNTTVGVGGLGDPASDFGSRRITRISARRLPSGGCRKGRFDAAGHRSVQSAGCFRPGGRQLIIDPLGLLNTLGAEDDWLPAFTLVRSGMTAIDARVTSRKSMTWRSHPSISTPPCAAYIVNSGTPDLSRCRRTMKDRASMSSRLSPWNEKRLMLSHRSIALPSNLPSFLRFYR